MLEDVFQPLLLLASGWGAGCSGTLMRHARETLTCWLQRRGNSTWWAVIQPGMRMKSRQRATKEVLQCKSFGVPAGEAWPWAELHSELLVQLLQWEGPILLRKTI